MNEILIERIDFENYRQYGTGSIAFSVHGKNLLSVLVAQNGIGKTTILNAITWCLYNKEKHLPEDLQALPIINTAILRESKAKEIKTVSITITVLCDDKIIEFKRSQKFGVFENTLGEKNVVAKEMTFTASTTVKDEFSNTDVREGVEADAVVKQYFDEDICEFYFFDGEKLSEFFAVGKSDTVKASIFNISQVSLLENTIKHLDALKNKLNRSIGKKYPDINTILDDLNDAKEQYEDAQNSHESAQKKCLELKKKLDGLNDTLSKLAPVHDLQVNRNKLQDEYKDIVEQEAEFKRAKSVFIRRYLTLLNFYPRIKKTYDYIIDKQEKGELPPSIDIDQVKKILDMHIDTCPMCDNKITEHSINYLQGILEKNNVSSRTSNYLSGIRDTLESLIDEATMFKTEKERIENDIQDIEGRKEKCLKQLDDISKTLKEYDYSESEIKAKVRDTASKIEQTQNLFTTQNQVLGATQSKIEMYEEQMKGLESNLISAKSKLNEHDETERQVKIIERLVDELKQVKENIMNEMKEEIEKTTWNYFDSMIWKKKTFGEIVIDDNYNISVYNSDNNLMTGSLSATEQMALAYAFALAIHKASGRNCPLVIDSPLGRVSDDNRKKMAKVLLEISKTKQIIMFLTPDEYSHSVKTLYDGVASVRELKLTSDECFVEGIDA